MIEVKAIVSEALSTLRVSVTEYEKYVMAHDSDKPLKQEENYVAYRLVDGEYEVYISRRGDMRVIAREVKEDYAIIWAAIEYRRHYVIDYRKSSLIRTLVSAGKNEEGMSIVKEKSDYYSESNENDCLAITRATNNNEIRYRTYQISSGLSDNNFYSVLYNYASLLQYICGFLEQYATLFDEERAEEMKFYFVTGRRKSDIDEQIASERYKSV